MLEALLHGKLSTNQENMEDLLTSCVFGAFKYLDYNSGLGAFLRQARHVETADSPFVGLDIQSATFDFWPYWADDHCENCEPDVVISVMGRNEEKLLIAVEVKNRSGKSGFSSDESDAPSDQLAKEWDHLVRIATRESYEPKLVYVTADAVMPREDIEQAAIEYSAKRRTAKGARPFECFWISWRCLFRVMDNAKDELATELRELARRLGFREFDGFSDLHAIGGSEWRYDIKYGWTDRIGDESDMNWKYDG